MVNALFPIASTPLKSCVINQHHIVIDVALVMPFNKNGVYYREQWLSHSNQMNHIARSCAVNVISVNEPMNIYIKQRLIQFKHSWSFQSKT